MTIICFKDGVLASDSRAMFNDLLLTDNFEKIASNGQAMGGWSGDAHVCRAFARWIKKGADLKKLPGGKGRGIIIYDQRMTPKSNDFRIVMVEQDTWYDLREPIAAVGSGSEVAIGALEAGLSAEETVKLVIKRVPSCGGDIQVRRFL